MAFFVSDMMPTPPQQFENDTQRCIYETLAQLGIEYLRVDTDDGSTMEDCIHISQGLQCPVVKTILLCNRQQTKFYMYVTTGEKPFVTKEFCGALGIPRVSFAPTEMLLEKLGTRMGATTVLSLINDTNHEVALVIDSEVAQREWYACTDGTTTCFMKFKMSNLFNRFLKHTGHQAIVI